MFQRATGIADHKDALSELVKIVTSNHCATVAVNAGGTGHAVGDIIDITNGAGVSDYVTQLEVTSVAAGVIDGVRVYNGGAYSVNPTPLTANAQTATTGSGISATFDLTYAATGWTLLARTQELDTIDSVAAAGSGYSIGNVLTAQGGALDTDGGGAEFTATVATVGGSGEVLTVTLTTRGRYEVFPTDPVIMAGGAGSGCTLNVTPRNITTGEDIVVMQGDAGSSTAPIVGFKTYSDETDEQGSNSVFNWAVFGMTSWGASSQLYQQPNITAGFDASDDITTSTSGDGAFVPLMDFAVSGYNIDMWVSATGRRVVVTFKVRDATTVNYPHCAFGLLNQFGIVNEYAYPAFIAGTSDRKRVWYLDSLSVYGGITEVIQRLHGPTFVFQPTGSWIEVKNASIGSNQTTVVSYSTGNDSPRAQVWPLGSSNVHENTIDQTFIAAPSVGFDQADLTLSVNAIRLYRTPDTGGDLFPLMPLSYLRNDSATDIFTVFGEVDGVFWMDKAGEVTLSSEDRIRQGSARYTIFQNGTRVNDWSYMALRED